DFLHGLGDDLADGLVVVGRDGPDLSNHVAGNGLGELIQFALAAFAGFLVDVASNHGDRFFDAALHGHRVGASRDRLHAFAVDALSQNGSGSGAVASHIRSLAGNFTHHLCAHVLERVFQFNFLGYGDAVLGNGRRTKFLFDDDVPALG